jgi:Uma2 family endonuclease
MPDTRPLAGRSARTRRPGPVTGAGHTLEDVLGLPTDAPRVELVDGDMVVVPSPTIRHQDIASLLWLWLRTHAPAGYQAVQAVGVAVALDRTFEPDVVLYRPGPTTDRHYLNADQVVLAVEVVSPRTRSRDRLDKPSGYAAAGIPYYWRVETDPVHVYAYQRRDDGQYELAAAGAEILELAQPFDLKLSVAEITP